MSVEDDVFSREFPNNFAATSSVEEITPNRAWKPTGHDWLELSKSKIGPVGGFIEMSASSRKYRRLEAKIARAKKWRKDYIPMAIAFPRLTRGGAK